MKKKLLKNERGDLSYFSVFVILAVNMLLSFLLLFASIKTGKKDEVSFVVTRIDEDRNVAVGLISRIIKQNIL